jgi:putative tryptophan/tyrosine transport system substrate-binding protein
MERQSDPYPSSLLNHYDTPLTGDGMKRREFILGCAVVTTSWPVLARAQQHRVRRIGVLTSYEEKDREAQERLSAFQQGLQELGWLENRNLQIEYRWAAGNTAHVRTYAAELAKMQIDAILTNGTPVTLAVQRETRSIPIVFANATDPVGSGLVASLAKPGGNITGFTNYEFSIGGKWIETLKQVAPQVVRVLILYNPANSSSVGMLRHIEAVLPSLKVEFSTAAAVEATALADAIEKFTHRGPGGGMIMLPDASILVHRAKILAAAQSHQLPAIYPFRNLPTEGGLMSYGVDASDVFRRASQYVDRILKGARPADLPVQNPTKFEFVINLKVAKSLGLVIPESLLLQADQVIE